GKRVLTYDNEGARLWDAGNGSEDKVLKGRWLLAGSATFSPDSRRVAAVSDTTVIVWDVGPTTARAMVEGWKIALQGHAQAVWSVAFSPDGTRIATTSADHTARLWDTETGQEITVLKGHGDVVVSAAFSHDCKRLVTASQDHTARLWDVEGATAS